MEYNLNTPLKGSIAMTENLHENAALMQDKNLYKFIWVQEGSIRISIDHVIYELKKDEIIPLTPVQHIEVKEVDGHYQCLLFNSNFYCIYGHDSEVSCNGLLFYGSSAIKRIKLTLGESTTLRNISQLFMEEYAIKDSLQEEMLRITLKRFIIACTRIARDRLSINSENEKSFDLIRRFYVLVDTHYKEKKLVKEYAGLLFRSPKTITNLFQKYHLPPPLSIIHERINSEAKRLLLFTEKNAKEIAEILGFEDLSTFSRFFKKMNHESIRDFRSKKKT